MAKDLAEFLLEASAKVKTFESEAKKALLNESDSSTYNNLIKQKAEFLASLSSNAVPFLAAEQDKRLSQQIGQALESFSANAHTALRLASPFYMSALLYPDDHKEGEPNNLDLLLECIGK